MTRFCKKHKGMQRLFLLLLIFFAATQSFAEEITDRDFGFSLDVPEGFEIADYTEDGMSYVFSHPNIPVTLIMKITSEENDYMRISPINISLKNNSLQSNCSTFIRKNIGGTIQE